jgi:hypothetical protein
MKKTLFRLSAVALVAGFGMVPAAALAEEIHLPDGRCATVSCGQGGCVIIDIHYCPDEVNPNG